MDAKQKNADLPKMADFLPGIRAQIAWINRPRSVKNKKSKTKAAEASAAVDEGIPTGSSPPEQQGEIYGDTKPNSTHTRKVVIGISKRGMGRASVIFKEKPPSKPFHVGFEFPNSSLHHKQVLTLLQQLLSTRDGARVVSLQYQERNVLFGARMVENRWVIEVNSFDAVDELLEVGIVIFNRKVRISKYDDMLEADYSEFARISKAQNLFQQKTT